ncbi:unnamed protein product [Blepharisma stoltei]|uniref:Amino acid transporter transmembrane domain-containing protein n=1 Tax=Blepharisma stoltei TaxID=1481888 RepID=A0AAU9IXX9_9CILI|nr:unnamed protein product [Blepharisma stoltei]
MSTEEKQSQSTQDMSSNAGFLFTINLIIGAGLLSVPYAFRLSGWLISGSYTIICCILGYVWSCQLIEVMSRCEALLQLKERGQNIARPSLKILLFGTNQVKSDLNRKILSYEDITPDITKRRIDISEIVDLIFGKHWQTVYLVLIVTVSILALASYGVVFSSSLASNIDIGIVNSCDIYQYEGFFNECKNTYWFYLAIFSGISIYLTLVEISEQKIVQSIIAYISMLNIVVVSSLCIISLAAGTMVDSDEPREGSDFIMADVYNIGTSLPIILLATIYQPSLPSVIEGFKEKLGIKKVLKRALIASLIIYIAMGIFVPLVVPNVHGQYNISFRNYSAGFSQEERPWWTYIIAYFLVLSPALGILSSFPLLAIPIAHNIISSIGLSKSTIGEYGTKLACCLIPLLIAFFEYNLGNILSIAGIILILLVSVAIPFMCIGAREMIETKSIYDFPYTPRIVSLAIIVVHMLIALSKIYSVVS